MIDQNTYHYVNLKLMYQDVFIGKNVISLRSKVNNTLVTVVDLTWWRLC